MKCLMSFTIGSMPPVKTTLSILNKYTLNLQQEGIIICLMTEFQSKML